jgi:hypothetical protein
MGLGHSIRVVCVFFLGGGHGHSKKHTVTDYENKRNFENYLVNILILNMKKERESTKTSNFPKS